MEAIATAFHAGRVSCRTTKEHFRWMVNTWIHIPKIISYLNRYPLQTRKHLVYLRWRKIYHMVLRKEHLAEDGLQKIRLQKGYLSTHNE